MELPDFLYWFCSFSFSRHSPPPGSSGQSAIHNPQSAISQPAHPQPATPNPQPPTPPSNGYGGRSPQSTIRNPQCKKGRSLQTITMDMIAKGLPPSCRLKVPGQ